MADATTISRLTSPVQGKPILGSSIFLCTRLLPPRGAHLVCNSFISGATRHFQQEQSIQSCPLFVNWALSHRPGVVGGRASQQPIHAWSGSSSRVEDTGLDSPPSSREEVVKQAAASLFTLLEKTLKKQGATTVKQRKSQRQVRLRVDIPVLEDPRQTLVSLTQDLLDCFFSGGKKIPGKVAVYFSDASQVDAALPSPSATYHSLDGSESLPQSALFALVIAPSFQQATALEVVVRSCGVRPVVVVNPDWLEEEEGDKTWGPFLASFCAAYAFIPLNIQGFFSKTEGAVLKRVRSGAPEGQPWLIYVKEGDNYKCVNRLKKRPSSTDLENALYSSMAANSPLNKSISFLRGLVSK